MKPPASKFTEEQLLAMKAAGLGDIVRGLPESKDNCTEYLNKFVTQNPEMKTLKERVRKIAPTDHTVLINGPSGTGKELLARALHGTRTGKFIAVNCAGIPESLAESELFGHVKGAFTNALKERKGCFEVAENGTIFLDEVAELSPTIQAKLLRVIQEGTITPVGSEEEREVNCRIVCATHQPIEEWAEYGRFREDLFYRLSTFMLKPTALVDRKRDVPLIIEALDHAGKVMPVIEEFVGRIPGHYAPIRNASGDEVYLKGNVRSLEQLVHRYVVLGLWPNEV